MEIIQKDDIWHDFFYTELTTGLRRGGDLRPQVGGL